MKKYFHILVLLSITTQPVFSEPPIHISNAWINEPPPAAKVAAGYINISNESESVIHLIAARSENFEHIEFHYTKIIDGIAVMERLDKITINAMTHFSFTPGKFHLMLIKPSNPVKRGDFIPLELEFSTGDTVKTEAQVLYDGQISHQH